MSRCLLLLLLVPSLATPPVAVAHHSYAMFDASRSVTVRGTVARLEWRNPHVYLWVYVPRPGGDGHDLYGFENGGVPVLERMGWTRDGLPVGETVTVDFAPLRDGRTGGHILRVTRADGSVLPGAGGAPPSSAAAGAPR